MDMQQVAARGLVLLGCGKMGSAMLAGWLADGFPAASVHVIDPNPSDWLRATGVGIGGDLPADPAIVIVAVKPQMMGAALPTLATMGGDGGGDAGGTLFISVAAGTPLAHFETVLGAGTPVVRAMPNTPAAVGRGITAIIGNDHATPAHLDLSETFLSAVGQVVRLEHESQMDAVTGLSGSGPAYVFHLIEAMAAAGHAAGLPETLAMRLARATVAGAGALVDASDDSAEQLRINVTSPNGTTQAGLEVLMHPDTGLPPLMRATVAAATARSEALRDG